MSPSTKPARDIKVHVPRHNSQRIGPAGTATIEALAREQRVRVDVRQTAYDPSSALAQAIESASDWNSLLMTARAERGPQWDVGTQLFLVDEYSELYYDPSSLLEYQKESRPSADGEEASTSTNNPTHSAPDFPSTPQAQHRHPPHAMHTPQHHSTQYFAATPNMPMGSPRHPFPGQGMGYGGMNHPVSPAQFYGGGDGMPASPMRMGMGGMRMGMGIGLHSPDAMGMGSPDVRRRVTRGMSAEDGFGGMHG
ncbi:hypothetical protein AcV5_008634 [Taiwanofungus camphoratus]|nr:hypothetical protein AcV5_008634 [Antrodia cinnamomea]